MEIIVNGHGSKDSIGNPNKLPLGLIPSSFHRATARALQYRTQKYAAHNWRKGISWTEVYSALQRHLIAWNDGENIDPESGLSHLDHAAACLAFLCEYETYPDLFDGYDDRAILRSET